MDQENLRKQMIEEYTPEYCNLLERVYGKGMMSEGGTESIEHMFLGVDLKGKVALDIGSGLGGVALYLAENHEMDLTGLDVNPWMQCEATRRVPKRLLDKLRYLMGEGDSHLQFPDAHFDIIYSKGVLTHVDKKERLFQEFKRVLKPHGTLVIVDWLSPTQDKWGANMKKMFETDGLTLFAHTKEHYLQVLQQAGFKDPDIRDDSVLYRSYNQKICDKLEVGEIKKDFTQTYGEEACRKNLEAYQAIVRALDTGELIVSRFITYAK